MRSQTSLSTIWLALESQITGAYMNRRQKHSLTDKARNITGLRAQNLLAPVVLRDCIQMPLRVSHKSIATFMKSGHCTGEDMKKKEREPSVDLHLITPHNNDTCFSGVRNIASCLLAGGRNTIPQGISLVVLRHPLARLVSSLYYWNCAKPGRDRRVRTTLRETGSNITSVQMRDVLKHSRTDANEQLIALSRGTMDVKQAVRNLELFNIVGITEDLDTFLAKVAIFNKWAPETLAVGNARVNTEGRHSACRVTTSDLGGDVLAELRQIVGHEITLYDAAKALHKAQNSAIPRIELEGAVARLRQARQEISRCTGKVSMPD